MKVSVSPLLLLLAVSNKAHAALQCTLSDPIVLDDDGLVTVEQVANREAGTFSMRIRYTGGQSWIGIGINWEGKDKMTPATAVIGRMLDGEASVLKYDLESDDKDASGVVPMEDQSLQDVSFIQTETESVLEFTQDLDDGDQVVSEDSVWIYAIGLPDNEWEGKHKIHGAFQIGLHENCVEIPESTSTPPSATEDPPADTTGGAVDTGDDEDSSSEQSDEDNQGTGNNPDSSSTTSSTSGGITKFVDATEQTRPLWVAHGFLLAIAWGICAPIAIGAPLLRNVSFLAKNGRWYSIHFYLNILNVLLTSIGFFLAVAATQQEGKEHFTKDVHHKAGLSIFLIILFQTVMGFVRPSPPPTTTTKANDTEEDSSAYPMKHTDTYKNSDLDDGGSPRVEHAVTVNSENGSGEVEIEEDSVSHPPNDTPTKSKTRLAWEISHRFIGMTLLGLAWYNCTSGIELQVEKYDESDDLTAVFWGICGGISGLIFLLAYVVRVGK